MQCQAAVRNALKSSPNSDINTLWSSSSVGCNFQYDQFRNTKQVFNAIKHANEEGIRLDLKSQGFIITSILLHASSKTRDLWSTVQKNMPKKIFNFTIKYSNNTLATRKTLCKWSLSSTSACSFYFQSETLQHIVSSCKSFLEDGRYTWRHNSVLLHLANSLSSFKNTSLFADLPSFPSPSLVTGDSLRPDLVLILNNTSVYLLELTVCFESNITINSDRKLAKYRPLFNSLRTNYTSIRFVNLSMSALGIFGTSSDTLLQMLQDLHLNANVQNNIVKKASNIAIRCSYYIYCRRNKQWTCPDLLSY